MARRLRLFISATPDLEEEREAISKALARFPAPLGWVIKRKPHRGEQSPGNLAEAIEESDFFALLLGADIQAPVGSELYAAQRAGLTPLAYLKETPHTLAARTFLRDAGLNWINFRTPEEVAHLLTQDLIREILDRAPVLEISPTEWNLLSDYLKEPHRDKSILEEEPRADGGKDTSVGEGGIIMVPEREEPSDGVLLTSKKGEED